jgi:tetratricopeptide (TPR) repeat protein
MQEARQTRGRQRALPVRVALTAAAIVLALTACTTAGILASLVPDGTTAMLLGNLEKVSEVNRRRVAELERATRWDDLAKLAEENIAKDGYNADWWLVLGYARSSAGAHEAAAKAYGEAVRLEPDNESAWNLLAQSHRARGDSRRALGVLNNALLALREVPVTVYLLAESYSDLGRYAEARAAYEKSLSMEPQFAAAWFGLARAYERLGLTKEAKEARAKLAKLDPQLAARLDAPPSKADAALR